MDHGLPLWLSLSYILPDLIAQPFSIFGTLAIAESQAPEQMPEVKGQPPARIRHVSRNRPRKMETSSLGSVLSLYGRLPNRVSRIIKASFVNMIAERMIAWPCAWFMQKLTRKDYSLRNPIKSFFLTGIFEIGTTLFDWRFLQLNSKMLPILLPNLANAIINFLLYQLSDTILDQFNELITSFTQGTSISSYKLGLAFVFVLSSTLLLFGCEALVEVWRVKSDLMVLNAENTIIPIDDSYDGDVLHMLKTKDYDILDALKRYSMVYGLPVALIYLFAGVTAPVIGQYAEGGPELRSEDL